MGWWVNLDASGAVIGRSRSRMSAGQEYVEVEADDMRAFALEHARQRKRAEIAQAFRAVVAQGMPHGGKVLQIDDESRANVAAIAVRAMAVSLGVPGMTWPDGFAWRMADNTWMRMDAPTFLAMAQKAADRYTALRVRLGALKDATTAAQSKADLEAVIVAFP